ncbi:MAG: MBOAT family protein, partial [Lysinibacillus sp.]|nr:MBOAT family protein [Lysinibacillus sp.]
YSFDYIKTMFFIGDAPLYDYRTLLLLNDYALYFVVAIILAIPIYQLYQKWSEKKAEESKGFYVSLRLVQTGYYLLIVLIVTMFLVNSTHNPFIYFRF